MPNSLQPATDAFTASGVHRVAAACGRFEAAWKAARSADQRPRIEDYLAAATDPERATLLGELIALDMDYRQRASEKPHWEDYRGRFPQWGAAQLSSTTPAECRPGPTPPSSARPTASLAEAESLCGTPGTHIRCPNCHNPIVLADEQSDQVLCPGCGSSFRVPEARQTTTAAGMRPLGRFQLLERVGLGAFGAVWKARDTELDRIVALKIPHAGLLIDRNELERFHREARAAAQLRHPGIVTVHEVQVLDGLPTLVLDFIDGVPLREFMEGRKLTFRETAALLAEVAEALDYAHGTGLVHRDIKPANIILDYGRANRDGDAATKGASKADTARIGRPMLMDFGLALREQAEVTMTLDGHVIGTPAYMSPEQAAGKGHAADRRSDVYSLGVVLYELLTGELPFRGSKMMIMHQVLREEPRPPRRLNDKIPRDLETICLKALEKDPARRYPTARELADDLRCWLRAEPIRARPATAWERSWKWVKRRPAVAALCGLVFLVAMVGFVLVFWQWRRAEAKADDELEARQAALQAKQDESDLRGWTERHLYLSNVRLADRDWSANNVGRARDVLAECPPERRRWEWHYLDRLCHSEMLLLSGHTDSVSSAAFSPDGRYLASGSRDQTVKIWDAATGQELLTLPGHPKHFWRVVFSPDGNRLASASGFPAEPAETGDVIVWDLQFSSPSGGVVHAKELLHLRQLTGENSNVAFSPDSERLAVASGNVLGKPGSVKIIKLSSGEELFTVSSAQEGVFGVAFSPDGRRLASASGNPDDSSNKSRAAVQIWDAETGKELQKLSDHAGTLYGVAFSPDGQHLASVGSDKLVRLWETVNYKKVRTLRGHTAPIRGLAFAPGGKQLATGGEDRAIKVWNLETEEELLTLRGHTTDVYSVAYHPDGKRLASAGMDPTVRVWDVTTGQEARTLRHHDASVHGLAFSPDGRWLASGGHDRTVRLCSLQKAGDSYTLGRHDEAVWCVAFSSDGRWLASGSGDWSKKEQLGEIKIWDVTTRQERFRLKAHVGVVRSIAFSPNGKWMATEGGEYFSPGEVKVWDAATGRERLGIPQERGVSQVVFSPDGERLAGAVPHAMLVKVWNATTGEEILSLPQGSNRPWCVAFSPDGQQLVAGGSDQIIRVWDTASGRLLHTLRGHTSDVQSLAFSPDGQRLASASNDQTLKLWDVASDQEVLTLKGHTAIVWSVAFSPDGLRIASGSDDETVRIWDATPRDLAAPIGGK